MAANEAHSMKTRFGAYELDETAHELRKNGVGIHLQDQPWEVLCALLERLRALWLGAGGVPPFEDRWNIVFAFAAEVRALGPANFIYSDGDVLYVHAHRRMHGTEGIRPPGLHVIERRCPAGEHSWNALGLAIGSGGGEQRVFLAASVPLTEETAWQALAEGELVAARGGEIVRRVV